MAKFTLTIETDDAGELAALTDAIAFASPSTNPNAYRAEGDDLYEDTPPAAATLEDGDKPKRVRRTKAQIAADEATARQPAPPKDDFAAQVRESAAEVAAEKTPAVTGVTLEQLKGQMEKLAGVMPPLDIQKLLIEAFNVKGAGALAPAQYDACFAMLTEAYEMATANG